MVERCARLLERVSPVPLMKEIAVIVSVRSRVRLASQEAIR